MSPIPDDIARHVALALSAEFGPGLPMAVEARLQAGDADPGGPRQFSADTVIALASLLVTVAALAYDIYKDVRPMPPPEVMERRLRIDIAIDDIAIDDRLARDRRDRIVKAVVAEIRRTLGQP